MLEWYVCGWMALAYRETAGMVELPNNPAVVSIAVGIETRTHS
jgi:hypothetical protein